MISISVIGIIIIIINLTVNGLKKNIFKWFNFQQSYILLHYLIIINFRKFGRQNIRMFASDGTNFNFLSILNLNEIMVIQDICVSFVGSVHE